MIYISLEDAKKIVEKLKTDENFKQKIIAGKSREKKFELIKEAAFDFTYEELILYRKEIPDEIVELLCDNISWQYMLNEMNRRLSCS